MGKLEKVSQKVNCRSQEYARLDTAPVFGKPECIYDRVMKLISLKTISGNVTAKLMLSSGDKACLTLIPYSKNTLRFMLNFNEVEEKDFEPLLEEMSLSNDTFDNVKTANRITTISFKKYKIILHHMPFRFEVWEKGKQEPVLSTYGMILRPDYPFLDRIGKRISCVSSIEESFITFYLENGGDVQAAYNGMAGTLQGILSLGLSGFTFDAHDIGGFLGTPDEGLYIRWTQFGLLSGITRFHGTSPREPWLFGKRALSNFRKYAKLRYKLMPYLYHSAMDSAIRSLPLMRALVIEYPDDLTTRKIDTEYLLGDDILIAPVLHQDKVVKVYLPEGEWIYYWNHKLYEGGRYYNLNVKLQEIPLFIKRNSRCN